MTLCTQPGSPPAAARLAAATLLAGLLSCCAEEAPQAPQAPGSAVASPNVLLICLDTVRADHMGAYGYQLRPTTPHLDAVARDGLVFSDTSSAAAWTKPSVPSFFTGSWPAVHGVYEGSARRGGTLTTDVLGEASHTLAEAFSEAGYETAAFLRNAQLRPGRGFEQGFDLYVDQAGDAAQICAAAMEWLDQRESERPFFLYLHILDAHWPYDIPLEAATRFADESIVKLISGKGWRERRDAINDGKLQLDKEQQRQMLALYDGAIAYADEQLGWLFEELDRRGLFEQLVVSMVADHGEEFLEHGRLGHGHGLLENLTRVGWILDGPGIAPARIDTPVSLVDLYPTLLAAAGLDTCDEASASRLRGVDRLDHPERLTPIFCEHKSPDGYWQSLRVGHYKLVRRFDPPKKQGGEDSVAEGLLRADRWEVELRPGWADGLLAEQIKPRDESGDDPLEIKGVIEGRNDGELQLAGLTVILSPETPPRVSGTLASPAELLPGTAAKLKVVPTEGGLLAVAAKGYASTDIDTELRGPVTRVSDNGDGSGTFWLAGLPLHYDSETVWKHMPEGTRDALLEREDVARLLSLGAAAAEQAGFTVSRKLFDLQADPQEQAPLAELSPEQTEQLQSLDMRLDALGRGLIADRLWSDADGVALGEDDVAALRAIGYVR